uniref:Protein U83A n=1 Tax=Human betaherpesvirus 6A TaxID=32603 RepID=A0A8E4LEM7_9BETA|nr:protein U83A [Human betaherpesvirus 6A]QOI15016.1 protein U83A [Human betaherpesvirus 6A]QOI15100.1 protein U83A [Human betaherpesvirus 6A]QOI15185.1 protein U83A [Human betaherpesvirus 6A]QOI15273.1 protein U83A [Human betaherpesvirus 6A]
MSSNTFMILCLISTILIQDLSAMHLPYHTSSPAPNQTGTAADQSMQHNKHPNKTEDEIRDFSENSSASGELHINPIAIPIYAV